MGNKRETQIRFVMLMMQPHRASGGWVSIETIKEACDISRATAYRFITRASEGGLPLVMDSDDGKRRRASENLGVRCNLVAESRAPDAIASSRRECMSNANGMGPHTLAGIP